MVIKIPEELGELLDLKLTTSLPNKEEIVIDSQLPTLIYNFYNLDPNWKSDLEANRILLLEPSIFNDYPISEQTLNFVLELSKNIDSIQIFLIYTLKNIH
jgi:deoxyribodipyrimidine photo-lyase